ncbi:MAG: hypothetical protein CMN78_02280 [Spirochaetales bacterium]|nr:hypothetical protein [Spirochaetales bacterium]
MERKKNILMIKALLFANIKANWGAWLFVTLILLIYVSTSVTMYDPASVEKMEDMFKLLPEGMLKAFGFDSLGSNLTEYLAHYLYGFIMLVFPVIYIVLASNKLVVKHVDSGSMAYLLTTPNSRIKIASNQAFYLLVSLALLFIVDVGILVALSVSMFPGMLDVGKFLALNAITYLVLAVICGIGFFFSCLFSDTRNSIAFGGGIPAIFLMVKMVSEISSKLEWLKYLTIYKFINIDRIMNDNTYVATTGLILIGVSSVLFLGAIRIFDRKSLTI